MSNLQRIDAATAEKYVWGRECEGWHLVRASGLSVIQERMPPRTSETRHTHSRALQFFFILAGTATIECSGVRMTLGRLQGLEVPPQTPHQVFNDTDEPLEFIVVSSPPSHGDREPA
jgi:mannose-6-phosphate isomerase-like protein (cupin superfamily)